MLQRRALEPVRPDCLSRQGEVAAAFDAFSSQRINPAALVACFETCPRSSSSRACHCLCGRGSRLERPPPRSPWPVLVNNARRISACWPRRAGEGDQQDDRCGDTFGQNDSSKLRFWRFDAFAEPAFPMPRCWCAGQCRQMIAVAASGP